MATIDSMTFDQASYEVGQTITLTVAYTPDSPSVVPVTETATTQITDPAGNVLATSSADMVINELQPSGDTLSTTDTGNHTWTQASDTGAVAVFTTTA
jgi:hypothetical protein